MIQEILLVLTLGVAAGWLGRRVGLPAAVGQVALGAVLGPSVLGWVSPDEALRLLAEIGVVLLLGMAGLQIGLDRLLAPSIDKQMPLCRPRDRAKNTAKIRRGRSENLQD